MISVKSKVGTSDLKHENRQRRSRNLHFDKHPRYRVRVLLTFADTDVYFLRTYCTSYEGSNQPLKREHRGKKVPVAPLSLRNFAP